MKETITLPAPLGALARWSLTAMLVPAAILATTTCKPHILKRGQPSQDPGAPCVVTEESRAVLRTSEGYNVYVEPDVLSRDGARMLLAGTPNYLYNPSAAPPKHVLANSMFGVVFDDGVARRIPPPVAEMTWAPRAAVNPDGGWDVVFAQLPGSYKFPDRETPLAIWAARLDGTSWKDLEEIPYTSGVQLTTINASPLVRRGDTLSWATTYERGPERGVILFERRGRRWFSELIPIALTNSVSLAQSPVHGLLLLVARGNENGSFFESAVEVYARSPDWKRLGEPLDAGGNAYGIQFTSDRGSDVITWSATVPSGQSSREQAMVTSRALGLPKAPVRVLDAEVSGVAAVESRSGSTIWIVAGVGSDTASLPLRFYTNLPDDIRHLGTLRNPFTGQFAATEDAQGYILLAGPQLRAGDENAPLVSLLARYQTRCNNESN